MKNKYSKITLCAHFDGELLEKVSSKISQDLVENAESVKFLEEIAEICKCPIGTVSARLTRGIKEMRKLLREHIE